MAIFSLINWGLRLSIDFTGGTIIEIRNSKLETRNEKEKDKIREIIEKAEEVSLSSVQESGENTYLLKLKPIEHLKKDEVMRNLEEEFGEAEELRFETIGPILGKEMVTKTIIGIFIAASFILAYVAYRFKDKKYGICAVLAMFHDSFILLGVFSLLGHFYSVEVDTLFVTAVLTTLSFSVHDTIVVYDRIRESVKEFPKSSFIDVINKALTETMGRSVNNSLTIIFMLLSLYLLGGETIKWFVLALLIGTIAGTYSSPFVATPLLVVWETFKKKRKM